MENIVPTSFQTPIEIALGVDENGMTTARKEKIWMIYLRK